VTSRLGTGKSITFFYSVGKFHQSWLVFSRKFYAKNITYKKMLILYSQADLLANLWVPFISGETIVDECVDVFFLSTKKVKQKLQHV
jgi:hypothetical protein